jgi:hypothetical protein
MGFPAVMSGMKHYGNASDLFSIAATDRPPLGVTLAISLDGGPVSLN